MHMDSDTSSSRVDMSSRLSSNEMSSSSSSSVTLLGKYLEFGIDIDDIDEIARQAL
jgi:hypothetical protein